MLNPFNEVKNIAKNIGALPPCIGCNDHTTSSLRFSNGSAGTMFFTIC